MIISGAYAWIWAGVASAKDPEALFQIQRKTEAQLF